jgi:hypothetical protein
MSVPEQESDNLSFVIRKRAGRICIVMRCHPRTQHRRSSRIICDGLRVSVAAVIRTRKVNYFEYKQTGQPACSLGTARFLCYNRPKKSRSL